MYLKCLLICQLLAILLVKDSLALTCIPCYMRKCPVDLSCPGGTVMGVCGCCQDCARVKNENCGGPFNLFGICDQGLKCVKSEWDLFDSVGVCQEEFIEKLKRLRK
ncbi:cysteine-rich motor neuron 1 protein [Ictalurus furcatus]|uniref:cysteine-rich motor neuron 1 protein n=1 Tax=Ictalurus furcatus TaxID=66913 RepID=UPI00234FDAFA|nr:cysteine-rich motor neuron 1 protein [Ictalurus furcatus]